MIWLHFLELIVVLDLQLELSLKTQKLASLGINVENQSKQDNNGVSVEAPAIANHVDTPKEPAQAPVSSSPPSSTGATVAISSPPSLSAIWKHKDRNGRIMRSSGGRYGSIELVDDMINLVKVN